MLGDHPIDVVLLATDINVSKDFYAKKVGLRVLYDTPGAVTFECGGGSRLAISKSSVGTKDEQTQAAFRVRDIRAEVAEHSPDLKTVDGIADVGFAWMAWFIDPGKNCVGMLQAKG